MSAASEELPPQAVKRGFAQGAYSAFLAQLSLDHPALWRLRLDVLALFGAAAGLVSFLVLVDLALPIALFRINGSPLFEYGRVHPVFVALATLVSFGAALYWLYLIMQPVRVRFVTNFQNRPRVSTMLGVVFAVLAWPTVLSGLVSIFLGASPWQDFAGLGILASPIFILFAVAAILALFAKSVLMSSVARAIGALALAVAILVGVGAILGAILAGVFIESARGALDSSTGGAVAVLVGWALAVPATWAVSVQVFRSRARLRLRIMRSLAVIALAAAITWGTFRLWPTQVKLNVDSAPQMAAAYLIVVPVLAYLAPHVAAIGGDLWRGARSRLTRPVLISCLWSAPWTIIQACLYTALGTGASSEWIVASVVIGCAISVLAVEGLCALTVRISALPEP